MTLQRLARGLMAPKALTFVTIPFSSVLALCNISRNSACNTSVALEVLVRANRQVKEKKCKGHQDDSVDERIVFSTKSSGTTGYPPAKG